MVCCVLFSGKPLEEDPRKDNVKTFKVSMMEAPCADFGCFCGSCLCPCCAQMVIRKKALHNDMSRYVCCQGYYDNVCPCVKAGSCGEASCPWLCLCCEAFCCNSCAVSATRMLVMDERNIRPDPWDNRIIRCNNFLQMLSCICDILAICIAELRDFASILRCIADLVYSIVQGCMTAQVNIELKEPANNNNYNSAPAPKAQTISRV